MADHRYESRGRAELIHIHKSRKKRMRDMYVHAGTHPF